MHWYGGSIAEAVTLSKQRNAIFVVFVEGDNDMSAEMAATIDDSAVLSRLSDQANFLAVKLKSGSTNYTHFAQIYQFVPVPSLFFIGRNGTPLEVVCAGVQPSNLAVRIDRILEEHLKDKQPSPGGMQSSVPSMQASTSMSALQSRSPTAGREQTVSFMQTEAAALARQVAEKDKPDKLIPDMESASGSPRAKIPKTDPQDASSEKSAELEVVCSGDVCVRRPMPASDQPGPSQPDLTSTPVPTSPPVPTSQPPLTSLPILISQQAATSQPVPTSQPDMQATADAQETVLHTTESLGSMEEKMERAKELIEARRREKADKEKELEKEKEMERRAAGKGVAELKRWQADQELKQIQEERRRERLENSLARQRILEQIAQDRRERRARDLPTPTPTPTAASTPTPTPTTAAAACHAAQPPATWGDGGGRARIQFKLPDGTSHTAHFPADAALADLQRYVADNLQMSAFSLWTAFPRRELTGAESSLRGLQLAPSAALLVLPRAPASALARSTPFAALFSFFTQLFTTMILEPSQQLYVWLRMRLFPPSAAGPPTPAASPPAAGGAAPGAGGAAALRRRGNIHRLPSDRASDDDNNTWNGNSTQQM